MPPPLNWTPDLSQAQPGSDAALALGWTWPAARQACDDHKRGTFTLSWQLWTDMDSLPAIRAAKEQRIAAPDGLPWEVLGPDRAPGRLERDSARRVWRDHMRRILRGTFEDVIGMGFSVWQHPSAVNPVTLRREVVTVERFPLSQIRFTATPFPDVWEPGRWINRYYAIQFGVGETIGTTMYGPQTLFGNAVGPIPDAARVPGANGVWFRFVQLPNPGETDGHWTVIGEGDQPHLHGAVTALDVAYVGGSILKRAMFNLAKTLGRQSPVGELPPSTPVDSPEGKDLEKVVAGLGTTTAGAVLPGGAKIGAFSLTTQNAELFPSFAGLNLEDVELAILGRSGTMAKEDAQYVAAKGPVQRVPEKLIRRDVGQIERAASRLFQTIAEQNTDRPGRIYLTGHLPDTEQEERIAARQKREQMEATKLQEFWKAVEAERDVGFDFPPTPEGQARLDILAVRCGVVAPKIPPEGLPPPLVKIPKPTVPITGEGAAPLPPAPVAQAPAAA